MSSTPEIGDAFRDAVCSLLQTQYPDAKVEQRLGGTKVDIQFTKEDFGDRRVYAVECKDYGRPLTKTFIAEKIYSVYDPLLRASAAQHVLIVSREPLGADASAYVNMWPNASHRTYEQLAESLIGLRRYIQMLAELRPTDDLSYIEARVEASDELAINLLETWLRSEQNSGLAILGGYGQGKTSFARRVASHYAKRYLANPTERMPILLRLGEVVHETQLEGLFGKEFTARYPAPGYQFRTLQHLNEAGRLLVILDGFDEMKHAMTGADFQSTFKEFNRLLGSRAKVVLLGRPNALPSDERELVLRGNKKVGDQVVPSATYAEWVEWRLAFFSQAEARQLLTSSLDSLVCKHAKNGRFSYQQDFVSSRVSEVFVQVPSDLLKRPVHVQLLAELAADPSFNFEGFNEYKLYDHFIRTMVERDTVQKPARRPISLDARLTFQRELAWWAWRRLGATQGCFYRHEIPTSLLADLPAGNAIDEEGKRNEYLVSTLTEEKETGLLYFAHRSFQEFLVAERLRLNVPTPAAHVEYSSFLTEDVIGFLRQAPTLDFVLDWYETLRGASGPLGAGYLEFFASFPTLIEHMRRTTLAGEFHELDAWTVSILYFSWREQTRGALDTQALLALLSQVVRKAQSDAAAIATLGMLGIYQNRLEPPILAQLVGGLLERCLRASRRDSTSNNLAIKKEDADFATEWLANAVKKHFPAHGQVDVAGLDFNLTSLELHCARELHPKGATGAPQNPFGDSSFSGTISPVRVEAAKAYEAIDVELRKAYRAFLTDKRPNFVVVPVEQKRRPS